MRSFSSFTFRSPRCRSLFSLTSRALSALYGSRMVSRFRLSFSVFPAASLAFLRLSVVWTRSLTYTWKQFDYAKDIVSFFCLQAVSKRSHFYCLLQLGYLSIWIKLNSKFIQHSECLIWHLPEEFLNQGETLDGQRLPVAQLIQTLAQIDELPLCARRHGRSTLVNTPL